MDVGLLDGRPQESGDSSALVTWCGRFTGFVVFILATCVVVLEPNQYGIRKNLLTGYISDQAERGGIHFLGPLKTFFVVPAAQGTLQWSWRGGDRAPVQTRTGADPQDPDSGGQPISISCAVQVKFVPELIQQVYLSFGSFEAARQRYLLLAGNVVSNTAQEFVPTDFWSKRKAISDRMLYKINHTLWHQGYVEAMQFEIMKVDFAKQFEDSITAVQVAEQAKVVNEYEQQAPQSPMVQRVVQHISVLQSENQATIANISAGAEAKSKEIRAAARRDAFNLKQSMKAQKYAELRSSLDLDSSQMSEYFKVKSVQGQSSQGKEDRPHYHSQLYAPRAHRERADWWLVRSLKMFLPLDYGPPSARNVLPRGVVDLTRRMLSLQLGPFPAGPMDFGVSVEQEGRKWRSPVDALDALQNSMVESFDLGKPTRLKLAAVKF
eukprot:Skav205887  [mRNA]  locus=scaffold123:20439:29881:+ [translate_table: standard]